MKSSLKNRTIFTRDNLEVMRGMADECIDLIYLDPPFNSNHNYAAPIGSYAAGAEFKDTWTLDEIDLAWHGEIADIHPGLYSLLEATRQIHGDSMMAYLVYMAIRVMEMRRVLKPTGSIYLHCDPTASHYLKLMMDEIFGRGNFRNEVIWERSGGRSDANAFARVHDVLLAYQRSDVATWNQVYQPLSPDYINKQYRYEDSRGRYHTAPLRGGGVSGGTYSFTWKGLSSSLWRFPKERLDELDAQGLIHFPIKRGGVPRRKVYLKDSLGVAARDVITDISRASTSERTGYPTQKPLALLERIIKASSNEGDLILDPFCGCATTCVAAEKLDRQWVGIDVSEKAAELVKTRIQNELGFSLLRLIHRRDIPQDRGGERSKNVKHILYGMQEGKCNGCLTHFPFQNFEVDHLTPTSKGGADTDENLQLLCGYCNRVKGDRTQEYLISQVRMTG